MWKSKICLDIIFLNSLNELRYKCNFARTEEVHSLSIWRVRNMDIKRSVAVSPCQKCLSLSVVLNILRCICRINNTTLSRPAIERSGDIQRNLCDRMIQSCRGSCLWQEKIGFTGTWLQRGTWGWKEMKEDDSTERRRNLPWRQSHRCNCPSSASAPEGRPAGRSTCRCRRCWCAPCAGNLWARRSCSGLSWASDAACCCSVYRCSSSPAALGSTWSIAPRARCPRPSSPISSWT